jgi:hypothetical protein
MGASIEQQLDAIIRRVRELESWFAEAEAARARAEKVCKAANAYLTERSVAMRGMEANVSGMRMGLSLAVDAYLAGKEKDGG